MADDRCRVRVLHTHGAVATKHVAAESNETSSRWSMIDAESACCTHTAQLPQNMWRRKEGHVLTKMADDRCTVRVLHIRDAVAAKHVSSERTMRPHQDGRRSMQSPRVAHTRGSCRNTCGVGKKRFVITKMADDRCRVCRAHTAQLPQNMWRRKVTIPYPDGR